MLASWQCFVVAQMMVMLLSCFAMAQSRNTENTLKLDDPASRPMATIASVAWLAGTWQGKAFGGEVEEVWTLPSAGTMAGLFKLVHKGKPTMYEFELIIEEADSLSIRLKHFNADLSGWEEKNHFVSFPLVKLSENVAYFDGLTYRRVGADKLQVYVAIEHNGKVEEEELLLQRVNNKH